MQAYAPGCEKLQGFYRGIVLKHLSKGKCKIWIPTLHPKEWNSYEKADLLPDAEQASPLSFGTNEGLGIFSYPNIGSIVWCFFENGDQNLPVYFATSLGGPKAISQWDVARCMAGNHPNDAYVHHIEVKNSHMYFNEMGLVKIETHDNSSENTCTIIMDSDGNITLDSTSTIVLNSKNIVINGSTQVDVTAPNIKNTAEIQECIKSPSIKLDSSDGHTTIISDAEYSSNSPKTTII